MVCVAELSNFNERRYQQRQHDVDPTLEEPYTAARKFYSKRKLPHVQLLLGGERAAIADIMCTCTLTLLRALCFA